MKITSQIIVMAEFTGLWKNCRVIPGQHGDWDDVVGFPVMDDGTLADSEHSVPDYSKDRNATLDALLLLDSPQTIHYIYVLAQLAVDRGFCLIMPSAAQELEAFVKSLNRWEE